MTGKPAERKLTAELGDLRARLAETEEVLRAIRNGDVDAVVVSGGHGEQVYTLSGADSIYRQLVETMSEGAVTLSRDGVIHYANQAFARMLQMPLERVIGAQLRAFVDPVDQPALAGLIEAAAGGSSHGEVSVHAAGDSSVPLRLGLSRLQLDAETLVCVVATDLTEARKNENELRSLYADLEKRIAERTADLAASRLAALNMMDDAVEARRMAEATNRDLQHEMAERKRAEEDIRTLNSDLERRVAERTLQLEEASRAKSDFLANMSHELRTPLNSIIGFSEMLKDGVLGELDAKQRGFVADIFGAGTHLLSLINDILDLSKVEAGMLRLEASTVDVAALLKASTMIVREKAAAHRIRLDTRLDPALGTLLADERNLKQILYNLLSNAVKFTPDGGAVTLHARRCTRAEVAPDKALPGRLVALPPGADNQFLAITVEDSGIGIAAEHLPKLFVPFTQVDSSAARRQGGTGLGLSVVRKLAELHGGTVGVASRPGAGSQFCVWLPYREVAPAAQEDRTMPQFTASSTHERRAIARRKTD